MCAFITGEEEACNADSGGPVISNDNNELLLVGVLVYGIVPCRNTPPIFSGIGLVRDWIDEQLETYPPPLWEEAQN